MPILNTLPTPARPPARLLRAGALALLSALAGWQGAAQATPAATAPSASRTPAVGAHHAQPDARPAPLTPPQPSGPRLASNQGVPAGAEQPATANLPAGHATTAVNTPSPEENAAVLADEALPQTLGNRPPAPPLSATEAAPLLPGISSTLARLKPAIVYTAPPTTDPTDLAILAARKAFADNNLAAFQASAGLVPRGHVLSGYLDYWQLRLRLQQPGASDADYQAATADARRYIARQPHTLTADLLRRDWMLAAGRRQDWRSIDTLFPQWVLQDERAPYCLASLSALAKSPEGKRPPTRVLKTASGLLLQPERLNGPCTTLLQVMADRKLLSPQQLRRRLDLALEINSPADIRQAVALLPKPPSPKALEQALNKPAHALRKPGSATLARIAIARLARLDPARAAQQLQTSKTLRFSSADRHFLWSQIAAQGAQRLDPATLTWTRQALPATISDSTRVWQARAALAAQDWALLERVLRKMQPELRNTPTWTYWHARARAALGHTATARRSYESLARRHDYYGKLAREELGKPLTLPATPKAPAESLVDAIDARPGIRQAMAFYALGLRSEANREWNYQMRGLDTAHLRAAAVWANRHGLLDRAINAEERIPAGEPANYQIRFPTPFAEQLLSITHQQQIDPAWVYGLIRQESRFILQARSHVGASGLMQLMPATAKWVARQMGYSHYQPGQLNDLDTNLNFGSYYLKRALDDLDGSPVLASAGYNAGPRRAHAWRARLTRPVEGAIFAEIIPFAETRHYVKAVLSNTVDYAGLFTGQPQSLKQWLATITPKQPVDVAALP
ncbi:MAG: transglycosylase SLT domain-containing protein [Lautropia sp.]|nr:transglycosylase SLT domain-containing protein [Lautropia sp.]